MELDRHQKPWRGRTAVIVTRDTLRVAEALEATHENVMRDREYGNDGY